MRSLARTGPPDTGVGVLDRSIAILEAVERGARSLAAVVDATGIPRTTAHRLLKALETHGLLAHRSGQGYGLGPRWLRLAAAALPLQEAALRDVAHPALERLSSATGESAQLFVASDGERVCVDAAQSSNELRTIVRVGAALPLNVGSAGKVFMAWMPDEARLRLINAAPALTDRTPSGDRLARQVAAARRLGYATSAGEREPGVGSVSAPVLAEDGDLIAVVSISGPESRLGREDARRYAPAVVEAAREIEQGLGAGSEAGGPGIRTRS